MKTSIEDKIAKVHFTPVCQQNICNRTEQNRSTKQHKNKRTERFISVAKKLDVKNPRNQILFSK